MLQNVKQEVKRWDWKGQTIGEGENNIGIPVIIQRIERNYYQTKEVEIDLQIYDLSTTSFQCNNLFEFLTHYKLVENANLKYPVIINNHGSVIDGRHRICKAILKGDKKIKGIMILDSNVI